MYPQVHAPQKSSTACIPKCMLLKIKAVHSKTQARKTACIQKIMHPKMHASKDASQKSYIQMCIPKITHPKMHAPKNQNFMHVKMHTRKHQGSASKNSCIQNWMHPKNDASKMHASKNPKNFMQPIMHAPKNQISASLYLHFHASKNPDPCIPNFPAQCTHIKKNVFQKIPNSHTHTSKSKLHPFRTPKIYASKSRYIHKYDKSRGNIFWISIFCKNVCNR